MSTWYNFKASVKRQLGDVTASDDLFASACAAYAKAMISREVDHDLLMSKSYYNDFMALRKRLAGFQTSLVVGSTLDTAVRLLLPVDAQREGIQNYLTQLIKNANQEVKTFDVWLEKLMREAVIDLQSHIPCYRVGQETLYTEDDVTETSNVSRGPVPAEAQFKDAWYLTNIDALAISTDYVAGDYVSSNGRTYMVLTDGQISDLGAGLTTTDGSVETLDGLDFTFYYGEACLRSELVPIRWHDRYTLSTLRDGCHGNTDTPAMIAIDQESYSFYIWPKLDESHDALITWTSLKFDFADGDTVPFDESAENAVKEYVLSKYFLQIEQDRIQASSHNGAYNLLRARAAVDCKDRQSLKFLS